MNDGHWAAGNLNKENIPIKFHEELINESLMILLFSVDELSTNTSKQVKILNEYYDWSL